MSVELSQELCIVQNKILINKAPIGNKADLEADPAGHFND